MKPEIYRLPDTKTFRKRIRRAILTTNEIGLPLLAVLLGGVLNLAITQLPNLFQRDPILLPFILVFLALEGGFWMGVHFYMVSRFLDPIEDFLESAQKGKHNRELAKTALRISQEAPSFAVIWSVIFYFLGVTLGMLLIQIVYRFTISQNIQILAVGMSVGVLVSFFQYFTTRRVLLGLLKPILSHFPELVEDESLNYVRYRIRTKLLIAVIILCLSLVSIVGSQAYSYAMRSYQSRLGEIYLDRISSNKSALSKPEELSSEIINEKVRLTPDHQVMLLDKDGNWKAGDSVSKDMKKIFLNIMGLLPVKLEKNRPTIIKLMDREVYSAEISFQRYTVIRESLAGDYQLFVVLPGAYFEKHFRILWAFLFIALGFSIVLSIVYTSLASGEITVPLNSITSSLSKIAEGDLTESVMVISQDEIGVLARSQARMLTSLREVLGRIINATKSVEGTSEKLSLYSVQIQDGSERQHRSVEETSASIEEMNISIKGIAESVDTLARSAEESSASIMEMSATIDEVAENVESLSSAVEQATSSIQEMNASLQEVAENVQHLSRRSEEALKAFKQIENAIWSIGESSKQTAMLSADVATDAEQGAHSVQMTIRGIERIRKSSEDAAQVIDTLSQQANRIGNILNVIDDVTEETNLLALNAAIIAAQAGEHGKGFAVVADEIRDLAERTQASTREIADLIKSVQDGAKKAVETVFRSSKDVEEGVKLSQEAGSALTQILERARKTMEQTKEIAQATVSQSNSAKEVMTFFETINSMIAQVAQATQEQTKGSELIFKASQQIEQIAQHVKRATREQSIGSKQITQAIESIAQIINYINNAQSEQIKNAQAVLDAVKHIRKVADENAERVKELRTSVESMNFLATDLKELVNRFKLFEKEQKD